VEGGRHGRGSGARDMKWYEKWEGKKTGGMDNESRGGMWLGFTLAIVGF